MATEIVIVKHRDTKEPARIKIDRQETVNFEKDYVHAPDTSLFVGFPYGKISKKHADSAAKKAGFKFYKIIEADGILQIPVGEISENINNQL